MIIYEENARALWSRLSLLYRPMTFSEMFLNIMTQDYPDILREITDALKKDIPAKRIKALGALTPLMLAFEEAETFGYGTFVHEVCKMFFKLEHKDEICAILETIMTRQGHTVKEIFDMYN